MEGPAKFDPFTILLLISVIVSVVRLVVECRQLWRVRFPGLLGKRRLRLLIREKMREDGASGLDEDALLRAVLEVGSETPDAEVREMASAAGIPWGGVSQSEAAPPPSDASDVSGAASPPDQG